MKKLLFVFALLLAVGLSPALAQTKVMYAEITGNSNDLTITFKAVDADKVPAENFNSNTGVGTYVLSNSQPSYAKIKNSSPSDEDICYYIKKAEFDPSVADALPTSTAYWLSNMVNLETVEGIENLNTSEVTDMNLMFWSDRSLKVLDLSKFNTEKVTNMSAMFSGCSSLSNLDVSKFNTEKVENMEYMFNGCNHLTSLNVTNFNTAKVNKMNSMFAGCSSLTTLDVTKFNTANVKSMGSMFSNCTNLTSLNVSKFITDNVTDIGDMFSFCPNLTSLDVSKFNTANVTNMGSMFNGCSGLTSLDVSKFNTENVTMMNSMFSNCNALESLDVSNFNTAKVTDMGYMFQGCSSLPSLDVSKFNTANVTDMGFMFSDCNSLPSLDVSKFNTENVTNMWSMFNGCKLLKSLDVTKFKTANVTTMESMFKDCSSLSSLDVTNFNTAKVTTMGYMFSGCRLLPNLNVTKFDTQKVKDMSYMFRGCSSLPSLDVTKFDTRNVTNMRFMFMGCSSLPSLDVTNFNTSKVENMTYMFSGCQKLSTIDVSKFDVQNVNNFDGMFRQCNNLTSLDISSWTINVNKINSGAIGGVNDFANGCSSFIELNLGANDFSAVASYKKHNVFQNVGTTTALPCHLIITFDRSSLGDVTIDKKNSLPPYYNYYDGRFYIAEKLDCDKNLAEDYTPVAKENTDLWQANRQLTTNDWNTLVVPVALTLEQLQQSFGTGVQVCRLVSYSDKKLYYKNVGATESIPANEPVLVKPAEDIKNIGYANVNIEEATNDLTKTVTSGATSISFIGTYKSQLTLNDRSWMFYSPSWQAFVCSDGTAFIRKTRAYVKIDGIPVNSLKIAIDDNGVISDINRIDGEAVGQPEGPAYNLSGQRVGDDYKGIVIVNGKKVLRK